MIVAVSLSDHIGDRMVVVFMTSFILLPLLYIIGRVATLLIAFTSLRSLPDAAFIDVDWTTLIPHI
jgi:hypothetical protein